MFSAHICNQWYVRIMRWVVCWELLALAAGFHNCESMPTFYNTYLCIRIPKATFIIFLYEILPFFCDIHSFTFIQPTYNRKSRFNVHFIRLNCLSIVQMVSILHVIRCRTYVHHFHLISSESHRRTILAYL